MHIPVCETKKLNVLSFDEAFKTQQSILDEYDASKWLYVPAVYSEYRYILGTKGKNPLICIGINPSTAKPDSLDNTLKSVERTALFNGYDSFIMFNVYAQRATNPEDMDESFNDFLHKENMKAFRYILSLYKNKKPSVWAAWGTIIEKRPYLIKCLKDMVSVGNEYNAQWYSFGACSKKGHPHHPLYLKNGLTPDIFDIDKYIDSL